MMKTHLDGRWCSNAGSGLRPALFLWLVIVVAIFLSRPGLAAPHQHGESRIAMAVDGQVLTLELTAPGEDVLGFEHAPKSAAQKNRYRETMILLQSASDMFELDEKAACSPVRTRVLEEIAGADHDHGEFHIRYEYQCQKPDLLQQMKVLTFDHFSGMQRVKVIFLRSNVPLQRVLDRDNTIADFR
jgi:hypothetical protein